MFISLYDKIVELEDNYNSWLKNYINIVLTRLSNDDPICSLSDFEKFKFKCININIYDVVEGIRQIVETNSDDKFYGLCDTTDIGRHNYLPLRRVFSYSPLTDVEKVIEAFISKKDMFNNLSIGFPSAVKYIDNLIHNLKMLALYTNFTEDDISVGFVDEFSSDILNGMSIMVANNGITTPDDYIESDTISTEDEAGELKNAENLRDGIKSVGKAVLKIKNVIDAGRLNIKHFFDKFNLVRNAFYDKNLGKIDGLFEHYGSEAHVVENILIDDPVTILMGRCGKYLSDLIDHVVYIYHAYNNHMHKLFMCKSYPDMIVAVNKYLTNPDGKLPEDAAPGDVKKALIKDLRYKMAHAILDDNKVYGYTVDSITEKSYPPIKHVMVCLFMEKPHEAPVEQSVSDVFKSPESFKLMGKKFKEIVLESSKIVIHKMSHVTIADDYKRVSDTIGKFMKDSSNSIKMGETNKVETNSDQKNDLKKRLIVLKDHRGILESFIPLCVYVSDAGNAMYDIAVKVDHTCRDSLKSLLNTERQHADPRYKHDTSQGKDFRNTSVNQANRHERIANQNAKNKQDRKDIKQMVRGGMQSIGEDRNTRYQTR